MTRSSGEYSVMQMGGTGSAKRFRSRTVPLRFSRIGLNHSATQAVLYAVQQFDWSIGSGGYWLLSKSDGERMETDRVGTWIS